MVIYMACRPLLLFFMLPNIESFRTQTILAIYEVATSSSIDMESEDKTQRKTNIAHLWGTKVDEEVRDHPSITPCQGYLLNKHLTPKTDRYIKMSGLFNTVLFQKLYGVLCQQRKLFYYFEQVKMGNFSNQNQIWVIYCDSTSPHKYQRFFGPIMPPISIIISLLDGIF